MHLDTKDTVKLSDLIQWVKKELLSNEVFRDDAVPLFQIDEVTVEVNFVLTGEGEGGFDLRVVKAGAKVAEERVQKAIVRMRPTVVYKQVEAEFGEEQSKSMKQQAKHGLLKGEGPLSKDSVPKRE